MNTFTRTLDTQSVRSVWLEARSCLIDALLPLISALHIVAYIQDPYSRQLGCNSLYLKISLGSFEHHCGDAGYLWVDSLSIARIDTLAFWEDIRV